MAVFLSLIFWVGAAIGLWLLTYTWPDSWWGETFEKITKTAFVWLLAPGIGTYYGSMVTNKYFPDIQEIIIYKSIIYISVLYALLMLSLSLYFYFSNNPYSPTILEMATLVAQSMSFIFGAKMYHENG